MHAELEALMRELDGTRSVNITAREKGPIQQRYRQLKDALRDAYRQSSTQRGEALLNSAEQAFWAPTVHQAYTELAAPVTTTDRGKLSTCLYEARFTIGHTINSIDEMLKKADSK
jgi:hypothetical protein